MKTILNLGLGTTLFMYVMFSFGSHSWDPMTWDPSVTYWFGGFSALGFMTGMMVTYLDPDK